MDFDFDMDVEMLVPVGLALLGGFVALFTINGGFSRLVGVEQVHVNPIIKILATLGASVIGFVWGWMMMNR